VLNFYVKQFELNFKSDLSETNPT